MISQKYLYYNKFENISSQKPTKCYTCNKNEKYPHLLPQDIVDSLGLEKVEEVTVKSKNYGESRKIYGVVRLELKGRIGNFDVLAENEGSPPLIGQIVLERLDLVIEPSTKKVMPNPRSPEMPMVEVFHTERLKYLQII
ncbi:MAG: hypothetical protein HXS48_07360 [Theionarchaea archaeon]|nr:hypothetical protein [Theionarchaea archaeon]